MMQLFKRLFHPFNKSEQGFTTDAQKEIVVGTQKTLADMFRLDLSHLKLNDFTKGKIEVNVNGELIQTYFKVLDYKECGIFDTVLVKLSDTKSINVIFKCSEPSLVNDDQFHKVIDELNGIYGQDNNNSRLYSTPDSEHTERPFYVPFGRDWMDYPKYKYPVSVRRYMEDVFISIWGFRLQNMLSGE
jgi:hypothetical protein